MMRRPIHCPFGLGNRVAAIANGLSRWERIQFRWPVNRHCPATAAEMFPAGIAGVEFLPAPERPEFATRWGGLIAHCWDAAADRAAANAAYSRIMAAMVGTPVPDPSEVAIFGRFHRNPLGDPIALADAAMRVHPRFRFDRVFVLADMHREVIAARLAAGGFSPVLPSCTPLAADMHRTRSDVLTYASDWLTALSARVIIALDGPASALHPARAAGREIVYA
jgi:hypothetical protein